MSAWPQPAAAFPGLGPIPSTEQHLVRDYTVQLSKARGRYWDRKEQQGEEELSRRDLRHR